MPYKSDSQRRYFHYAESKGKISHKTVAEFDKASKGMDLPEHKQLKKMMDKRMKERHKTMAGK